MPFGTTQAPDDLGMCLMDRGLVHLDILSPPRGYFNKKISPL
jgi:hypothetical protein